MHNRHDDLVGMAKSNPPNDASLPRERRIPFTQRVAVVWMDDDPPQEGERHIRHWRRAPLTGELATTSEGGDISFSDLEVE